MRLHEIAHARAGDKGNTSNISLIAYDRADFALLEREVTAERVKAHFGALATGTVTRYALPQLGALNFVLKGSLRGGVTRSLAQDAHGKCFSGVLLDMEVPGSGG